MDPDWKITNRQMKAKKREAMGRDTLESAAKQRWNEEATQKYIAGLQRKLYSVSQELVEEKRATREMKEQDLLRQRLEGTVVKSLVKPDPMARIAADFKRVQTELVHMHMELAEKDSKLAEKDLKLAEKDSKLAEKDSELERRATDWLTKEIVLEGQIFDLKSQSNQKLPDSEPSSSGDSSLHATIDKLKEEKATLEGQKNNFRSMMLELAQENSAYKKREETMKEF